MYLFASDTYISNNYIIVWIKFKLGVKWIVYCLSLYYNGKYLYIGLTKINNLIYRIIFYRKVLSKWVTNFSEVVLYFTELQQTKVV